MNWFPFTYILDNLITNSIHAWLTKDYKLSGMSIAEYLGISFNTTYFTLAITSGRVLQITQLLNRWHHKHKATKKQLQCLIDKLFLLTKGVPPGRVFDGRLLDILRNRKGHKLTFQVDTEILIDVTWWSTFMKIYNGGSIILNDI